MNKLSKQQLSGIDELLKNINNKDIQQYILETIGKENWTREMLSNFSYNDLTEEQQNVLESFGGLYTSEEIDESLDNYDINCCIAEELKEKGVTHYLYENEDYLDDIREGKIICEGIDVKKIKNIVLG